MRALILVGGEGTRLRPLTFTTPKPLLPIVNQPFLERQLTWLGRHGVDEVVLSLGYLPDAFVEHFPDDHFGDVRLRYAVEPEPLGTAGAIRFAAEAAGDHSQRFVVCNGDVLTDLDLDRLLDLHEARGAEATITLSRVEDPSAFGVVPTREDGEVVEFVEKPPPGEAPSNWINAGTYLLEPSVLDRIPTGRAVSIERETFPEILTDPHQLYALEAEAYWLDIGTPEKYLQAHADVMGGRLGLPPAPGAQERLPGVWRSGPGDDLSTDVELGPPVVLGPEPWVGARARLVRSSLGARVEVGDHATVEDAVLGDDVHVGAGATVRRSVVGPGSRVGAGAVVVGESVVGAGVEIAADAKLDAARVPAP